MLTFCYEFYEKKMFVNYSYYVKPQDKVIELSNICIYKVYLVPIQYYK